MTRDSSGNAISPWTMMLWLVVVVGVVRIVASYGAVSQTIDEAIHVAAGMEWLDRGTYRLQQENPPLARIAVALGPYLAGSRSVNSLGEKNQTLMSRVSYRETLALARLGTIPFFVATILVVWFWGRRMFGRGAALAAAALFSTLPLVLAHGGLATTDMAATAGVAADLFAFVSWLEEPSKSRSVALGAASALAVLTKFSAIIFVLASGMSILGSRWALPGRSASGAARDHRRVVVGLFLASLVAVTLVWAGYRFSVTALRNEALRPYEALDQIVGTEGPLHDLAYAIVEAPIIPAPELFGGLQDLLAHDKQGHAAYLLGEKSQTGWWYFFPIAFLVKTPLPFLGFAAIGAASILKQSWRDRDWAPLTPLLSSVAIMAVALPSHLNIGLRHILPMYAPLSIAAGVGITGLWRSATRHVRAARAAAAGLCVWYAVTTAASHPAYLSYFNEIAGAHPERIIVDSDLDWGQDVGRLADELKTRKIKHVSLALFAPADLNRFNWPQYTILKPNQRASGWVAASIFEIKVITGFAWLEAYHPVTTVGATIRLYHILAQPK